MILAGEPRVAGRRAPARLHAVRDARHVALPATLPHGIWRLRARAAAATQPRRRGSRRRASGRVCSPVSVFTVTRAVDGLDDRRRRCPACRCAAASSSMPSSSISSRSLTRRTMIGPGSLRRRAATVGAPFGAVLRTGDRVAVRARGRVAEQLHELLLDVGGDRVLPAVGLARAPSPTRGRSRRRAGVRRAGGGARRWSRAPRPLSVRCRLRSPWSST